jgi:hypothetical protein
MLASVLKFVTSMCIQRAPSVPSRKRPGRRTRLWISAPPNSYCSPLKASLKPNWSAAYSLQLLFARARRPRRAGSSRTAGYRVHLVEARGQVVEQEHVVVAGELEVRVAEALPPVAGLLGARVRDPARDRPRLVLGDEVVEVHDARREGRRDHDVDHAAGQPVQGRDVGVELGLRQRIARADRLERRALRDLLVVVRLARDGGGAGRGVARGERAHGAHAPGVDDQGQAGVVPAQVRAGLGIDLRRIRRDVDADQPALAELADHLLAQIAHARRVDGRGALGADLGELEPVVVRAPARADVAVRGLAERVLARSHQVDRRVERVVFRVADLDLAHPVAGTLGLQVSRRRPPVEVRACLRWPRQGAAIASAVASVRALLRTLIGAPSIHPGEAALYTKWRFRWSGGAEPTGSSGHFSGG